VSPFACPGRSSRSFQFNDLQSPIQQTLHRPPVAAGARHRSREVDAIVVEFPKSFLGGSSVSVWGTNSGTSPGARVFRWWEPRVDLLGMLDRRSIPE
jgi:hypothetical protein